MLVTLNDRQEATVQPGRWQIDTNATLLLYERMRNRRPWDCQGGAGGVAVKCFFAGEAHYEMEGEGYARLDDQAYLLMNAHQPYRVHRPYTPRAESLLLFFHPDLAARVWRALITSDAALLDAPHPDPSAPPGLIPRRYGYASSDALTRRLRSARDRCRAGNKEPEGWDETFLYLLRDLYAVHLDARREMTRLPAVRPATREELYRRLYVARDYVAAFCDRPLTLAEIGRAAALSETHLLRSFRQLFGETPHDYLTRCRLERACRLLRATDLPVTDICLSVGFVSLGTFTTLFRRRMGVTPGQYRRGNDSRREFGDFEEARPMSLSAQ